LKRRYVRWGVVGAILAGLFLSFVPLVPYSYRVVCSGAFSCPPGGLVTGTNSITTYLFNWGGSYSHLLGTYSFGQGVNIGTLHYFIGTTGYTSTVFIPGLFVVVLSACALAILLSPEIADGTYLLSALVAHGTHIEDQKEQTP
jgi:hypothetical protein